VDCGCSCELGDGGGQRFGVRGEADLRPLRSARDEVGEGSEQIGVEARLGLVERQERRRAGAEQRREQAEVAERSVRTSIIPTGVKPLGVLLYAGKCVSV